MFKGLLFVVVLVLLAGCVVPAGSAIVVSGSGNPVTIEEDFTGFTKVAAGSAFRVEISQGEEYQVSITVDDNLEQHLDVKVQGDTLRIFLQPMVTLRSRPDAMRAVITMPSLRGLEVSGAVRAVVTGFESDADLNVQASGASNVQGDVTAGDVDMNVSGASRVTLEGAGGALNLDASGASFVNLSDFPVTGANVDVSGASQADLTVNGRLNGEVSGASRLYYRGDTQLGNVDTSGASTIEQR